MNLEHVNLVIQLVFVIATFIVLAIVAFRRRPPIEAEFITKAELDKICTLRHTPVKTDEELQREFVTRREYKAEKDLTDNFREELRRDVKRIDKNVTALATKMGIEVLDL